MRPAALCSFGGQLAEVKATKLGSIAITAAVQRAGIPPEYVQEAYLGNVCQANLGQAPARQAVMGGGLAQSCVATTVNKVCASGMKATALAAMGIQVGQCDIAIAGGFESMSNVPYYIEKGRFGGYRYGNGTLVDGMVHDGLWDAYGNFHMGVAAEKCAFDYKISREEQDQHAIDNYLRAHDAIRKGSFKKEICPVTITTKKGNITIAEDEEPSKVKIEKITTLRTAFKPLNAATEATVTAATSSSLNDGGGAMVIMSEARAQELGVRPLARILSYADAEQAPVDFTTAPSLAIPKALAYAGLKVDDIDLWEINQAFSVVSIANTRILDIDPAKVDVAGGAVALGHPIGCSGARIIITLLHNLQRHDKTLGCAAICNGGGGASAIVVERMD
jgi:acetyl-CoA C-acetyltransferase